MTPSDSPPRSIVAYEVARRLIYHTAAVDLAMSPVRSAQGRLDELLAQGKLSANDYRLLSALLRTVDGCDIDHCNAKDELVTELTRSLASMHRELPDARLALLAELM